MKFYEKAIAEFKKAEKKRYEKSIDNFIDNIANMLDDGKCRSIGCGFCPVRLYLGENWTKTPCTNLSQEKIKEIANSEV